MRQLPHPALSLASSMAERGKPHKSTGTLGSLIMRQLPLLAHLLASSLAEMGGYKQGKPHKSRHSKCEQFSSLFAEPASATVTQDLVSPQLLPVTPLAAFDAS